MKLQLVVLEILPNNLRVLNLNLRKRNSVLNC